MTKLQRIDTTVLLLHQDAGLKEDPYLAFLRTVPYMGEVPSGMLEVVRQAGLATRRRWRL
jgi:hypothetical protein